jgi:hypothetical protein
MFEDGLTPALRWTFRWLSLTCRYLQAESFFCFVVCRLFQALVPTFVLRSISVRRAQRTLRCRAIEHHPLFEPGSC